MTTTHIKDPAAILDYGWDWGEEWLDGDTISSHTITVSGSGLEADSSAHSDTAVTVWLSGGTNEKSYTVTCEIITAAGRTDQRSKVIVIRNQ